MTQSTDKPAATAAPALLLPAGFHAMPAGTERTATASVAAVFRAHGAPLPPATGPLASDPRNTEARRRQRLRRVARHDALARVDTAKLPAVTLQPAVMAAREATALQSAVARADRATDAAHLPLYCSVTGALIGTLNAATVAAMQCLSGGTGSATADDIFGGRFVHPAWLDKSPARLAILQREMPHEFVVYATGLFCMLGAFDAPAGRHAVLQWLYGAPLSAVIEAAELLRRGLAIFRKAVSTGRASPPVIDADTLALPAALFVAELRDFVRDTILACHAAAHSADINERASVITKADILNLSADIGDLQHRMATGSSAYNDTALDDVRDLFGDAVATRVVWRKVAGGTATTRKVPPAAPALQFTRTQHINAAQTPITALQLTPAPLAASPATLFAPPDAAAPVAGFRLTLPGGA